MQTFVIQYTLGETREDVYDHYYTVDAESKEILEKEFSNGFENWVVNYSKYRTEANGLREDYSKYGPKSNEQQEFLKLCEILFREKYTSAHSIILFDELIFATDASFATKGFKDFCKMSHFSIKTIDEFIMDKRPMKLE